MALIDPLMDPSNLITSVLLTFFPIIVLFVPYLFTRRKDENLLAIMFNRGYIGFIVFYVAYFIFPSILNAFVPDPNQYMNQEYYPIPGTNQWSTEWDSAAIVRTGDIYIPVPLIIKYLFQHFVNSVVIYLTYPIVILAFVFGISPIISVLILLYQTWGEKRNDRKPIRRLIKSNNDEIRALQKKHKESVSEEIDLTIKELKKDNEDLKRQLKEIKSVNERLREIQYETETSPFQEITKNVKEKNWENERELLKVLIAILPITLFLLMTILQLLGETENPSLLQGTSMGWFLEIFFAYIASIVFSVYLIKATRLSRKGKFLGNQLYIAMVQSLSTVGAFMSILAVILFLAMYFEQIFVVSYFVVYFIMVSIFFVLFLDILEPFSIYLLIKLIETFKSLKIAIKRISFVNISKSYAIGIIIGFLMALGFLAYRVFVQSIFINIETVQYHTFFWSTLNYATFLISAMLILFIRRWNWSVIGTSVITYISVLTVSLILFSWYDVGLYSIIGLEDDIFRYDNVPLITPFITVASIFAGIAGNIDVFWLTSVWKEGTYSEVHFIVPELRQVPVVWKGTGGTFLGILSVPYNLLHPLAILLTYGAILFLARQKFHIRVQRGEGKTFFKSVFSDVARLPTSTELKRKQDIFLIGTKSIDDPKMKEMIDEQWVAIDNGQRIKDAITGKMISLNELTQSTGFTYKEIHRILDTLTFDLEVPFYQVVNLLHREFSYSYEEVTIDSLHIMMLDGRAVLSHTFGEESQVEPALVAGLFSAITSFAKEAVRSEQLLKTIDHGDVVLTIEYAKWVFAAIFADSTSTELRRKLGEFLVGFE
ncbi:MAG: hypothetical protein ACFE95_23290, partial [Candidatus Hodarchaeota archaeon]